MILNEDAVFSKSCKNPVYIVLMNGKSPLASIILKATGDYFSHACIAFNDDLNPLYSFGAKSKTMQKGGMGFCISKPTDLSVFNKQAYYAVYVTYVTDEAYAKMKERLSYFTTNANKMIYDYVGLLNVWMHQSSDNRTRAYFCSRFVMDVIGAGVKLDKLPSLYRPQDIANMNNISLVNRGFDFHNYDKKITQKNEKLLKQGKLNPDDIIFEDVSSVIQKDFKSKHDMNLSQFEKMRLSDAAIQVYKQKLPSLSHVRINNNTKGYIWIDKKTDMPAAIVNVEEKDDGFTWIQAFEIFVPYKGHGLSKDILNVAIRELKATNLSVNKDNQVAIKVYKSYGFKTYKTTEAMYFMSIDKNDFDDDEDIYDESTILESNNNSHFYFYHLLPKGSNISPGIVSLDYQYHHDIQEFRKNSDKYRERLCNEWGIYSGKSPASLSDKEIYDGINKFRKTSQGCNQIYLFRYPPTAKLGKQMGEILKSKDIYRVDLNELRDNGVITDVDFGYIDSNTDNTKLSEDWYVNISYDDYFKNYTESDPNRLLFSYMNHISVTPKNGYISKRFLTKIKQSDLSHIDESTIMESKNPYSKAIKDISSTPKIEYDRKAIRSKYSNIIFNSLKQQFSKKYKVCYTQVDNNHGIHDIVIYISTAVNAKEYYKSIDYGTNDYWNIIPQCTYTANKIYRIDDFNCYIILGDIIFFIYGAIVDNSDETNNTVEVDYCFDIDIVADLNTIGSKTNIEKSEALIVLQELMVNKIKDIKFDIYKDMLVFKNIDELVYNKISSKLKSPHYFNMRKVFNSKKQGTLYLISDKININESTIEDFEIEAETGFYDKHNRWNPIVIINGEQYRHRVECLIMRQNKLFVAKSNTGVLLIPGGGVDKSLSDEEQVYNECKEEARILVENIKPTGYAYLRRTGVSESAKRLPKEQQWVGSYTEIYIADYAKDFTGFIDYCDRDSEMIRGDFRPISEIIDKLVPEWKLALIDANYISVATEALKSYKDPKLALKRRMGIKRNNAVKLGDFSNVAKSAPTPQAQTISVPSPAVSSSAPSSAKPAQTTEETKEIPETVKANANRLLCKEIASYPKFSGCYYNMDYPLYNGNGHAIVGWKMTGVHYNDFDSFNMHRDRIYEYCSKIFEDTNPGYGLKMDKKTNCIYITEI